MKDATGELSMTAVAVVAIAAISVVFSTLIWPTIRANILRSTYCSQAFNCKTSSTAGEGMMDCNYCTEQEGQQKCDNVVQCAANESENAANK